MAIDLQAVIYRSPTRLRLLWTNELDAAAFDPVWFTVTSTGVGADPDVLAALVVPGSPRAVELVLSFAIAEDDPYVIHVDAGLPATDASTAPEVSTKLRTPAPPKPPAPSFIATELREFIYGIDLLWDQNGNGFVETIDYDIATATGAQNAIDAVLRRELSNGLPWNKDFGGQASEFVDAPNPGVALLTGRLTRQALADSRVEDASVSLALDDNSGDVFIEGQVKLIGEKKPRNLRVKVG